MTFRSDRTGSSNPWEGEGRVSIAFIFLTLLALAAVPIAVGVRLTAIEHRIAEVIDPARDLAADLSVIHARQMSRFQEFLLTGNPDAEFRYRELIREESETWTRLERLLADADVTVRALRAPVFNAAVDWQLGHVGAFTEQSREEFREGEQLATDLERYETLLRASTELRDELNERARAARRRVATVRDFQLLVTIGLVGLALFATLVVGRLSRRLRSLVQDVSDRHREALRVRRELDAVFDATADAVLEVDPDGRLLRLNAGGVRLLEWTEEAARGEPLARVLFGRAHEDEGADSPIVGAVTEGRSVDGEDGEVWGRRGEAETPVLWSTRPMEEGTRAGGVVLTLTDVTDIRAATRALQRAIRARDETLAVVSHDLRSPLSTVQAATELLLEVPLSEEKRTRQLRAVLHASERMERLIRDLLDLARIDAGGLSVQPEPVAAADLVREVIESMSSRATATDIVLEAAEPLPDVVLRADRDRLMQVFENLISNALRHTRAGGRVTVGLSAGTGFARFRVTDTGEGIRPEQIERLFDRFWRHEQEVSDGAGLGLAIVKGIVEAHGGEVRVESVLGEGSTFAFTVPLDDVESFPPAAVVDVD